MAQEEPEEPTEEETAPNVIEEPGEGVVPAQPLEEEGHPQEEEEEPEEEPAEGE